MLMFRPALYCIGVCTLHSGSALVGRQQQHRVASGLLSSSSTKLVGSSPRRQASINSSHSADMAVDITKDNFQAMLPVIKEALDKCTFYAFDCEMTGLFTDGNKHEFLDDIQARYSKITESSKAYVITQYGLSCFEATGPASYEARTFNFYVFPHPHGGYNRRFMCDASSLVFLASHGFDFNKCISEGVPCMPVRTRDFQLVQVNRSNEPRGDPVAVSSEEDKAFVAELIQLVTDWLAGRAPAGPGSTTAAGPDAARDGLTTDEDAMGSSADDDSAAALGAAAPALDELLLPPLNSYRRLLAYQELRKPQFGVEGHPGFWVKKMPDSRYLVLVRASAQQAEQLEAEARTARIAAIHNAAGFAAVFDLMRRSNKPAVGHNCMFDVAYGIYSFADSFLPATWRDFKKMVRSWHPGGIWDTKYISKRLPEVFQGNTSLAEVYSTLLEEGIAGDTLQLLQAASDAAGEPIQLPTIIHAPGFDKYRMLAAGEAAHEAGYDAYMTGAAFACLLPLVAGKVAAAPDSELAAAYKGRQERQAAAATNVSARAAGAATPNGSDWQQRLSVSPSPLSPLAAQQPQQLQPAEQGQEQHKQPPRLLSPWKAGDMIEFVQGARGRLNLTFTDISYAALWEDDPIPARPFTFHLSGLQAGYRVDDIWRMLQRQGLGSARITPVDSSSCLAEFRLEVAGAVIRTLADMDCGVVAMPWSEYALMRYHHQVPAVEDEAAAATAAVVAAAADGLGRRGVKRQRLEEPRRQEAGPRQNGRAAAAAALDSEEAAQEQQKSSCRIM